MTLQYRNVKRSLKAYDTAVQALQEEFEAGRAEMVAAHSRSRKEALETIAAMEGEHAESAADARQVTVTASSSVPRDRECQSH